VGAAKGNVSVTIDDVQNEIVEETAELQDWLSKYDYLINLGRNFEAPGREFRRDENALHGCQSQVWLKAEPQGDRVVFSADSDSLITRGILALLLRVLNNQPAKDVKSADLFFIDRLGLNTNLSPSRADGLALIVYQIRVHASKIGTE
jgi:cysteine desulfuration protein SufE